MSSIQKHKIEVLNNQEVKAYFLSDFHLSIKDIERSKVTEKNVIDFLKSVEDKITHLFLLGDIFDFWYEYKYVVPKGWTRLLGKLGELSDKGVKIYYFYGNHDLWFHNYLKKEIGLTFFKKDILIQLGRLKIYLGHGDEVGQGNLAYKFIKFFYRSYLFKLLFWIIPSNISFWICNHISRANKTNSSKKDFIFLGEDKEQQIIFAKKFLEQNPDINYFILGHRHFPNEIALTPISTYINTGDWISHFSYAYYDGKTIHLKYFKRSK